MAAVLAASLGGNGEYLNDLEKSCVRAAAAELRKKCATCVNFNPKSPYEDRRCLDKFGMWAVPVDGSGFCYRWSPKP